MNWISALQKSIAYMEEHLLEDMTPEDIASYCGYSAGHLARGFQIVTGYSFSEYIRNRRMYLAALELEQSKLKVIDVAMKYGYESPDSFTRAFRKFHGFTPNQIQANQKQIQIFMPLQIQIAVRGGTNMDYEISEIPAFQLIGKLYHVPAGQDSYKLIPEFWNEFMKQFEPAFNNEGAELPEAKAVWQNNIGEFGMCMDDPEKEGLDYMIGGKYRGGEIPEGFVVRSFPALIWARFTSCGPIPEALQKLNTQIFTEWLVQNPDYQLDQNFSAEYYPIGNPQAPDYRAQIWVPVKKKEE